MVGELQPFHPEGDSNPGVGCKLCMEMNWEREWAVSSTQLGEPPGTRFLRPVDAIIPGTRSPPICIATITGRGTSLPHLPGLGCHTD